MGEPVTGAWSRKFQAQVPYVGAMRWGTGINQVHAYRAPTGRPMNSKLDASGIEHIPAHFAASEDFIEYEAPWGYQPEDIAGLDVFADPNAALNGIQVVNDPDWPEWQNSEFQNTGGANIPSAGGSPAPDGFQTGFVRANVRPDTYHPWGIGRMALTLLHSMRAGQHDEDYKVSNEIPTETVNEGWINKAASGMEEGEIPDDNVMPSSTAQYERNTSMQQRHQMLNNDRAMERGADEPRTSIASRIAPMKLKVYSGEERHYDMFPYQIDDIPRPFTYRTAGTGPAEYLETNEQWLRTPLQRTPPPDPSMGIPDTELSDISQYGYSGEDTGYY